MSNEEAKTYDPVAEAYIVLTKAYFNNKNTKDTNEYGIAIENAIGFLGEALDN